VLGTKPEQPDLNYLRDSLAESNCSAIIKLEAGSEKNWTQLVLTHPNGPEIAAIEYNPVITGELGQEELDEFIAEVADCQPVSAAQWLKAYLPKVKAIFAFQLLSGTDIQNGWGAVHTLQGSIWSKTGGILQADSEGFSNEDGYQILWQFNDKVSGKWEMAILDRGNWVAFEMELGDLSQRKSFLEGNVPPQARLL
jgi:hypothetical protein